MLNSRLVHRRLIVLITLVQASIGVSTLLQRPAHGRENVDVREAEESAKFPGRIFLTIRQGRVGQNTSIAINPNDQAWTKLSDTAGPIRVSPDGKKVLATMRDPQTGKVQLMLNALDGEERPSRLFTFSGFVGTSAFWSADGKSAIVSQPTEPGSLNAFET